MKPLIVLFILVILISAAIYFGIQKIGDIRPAILPPSSNTPPNAAPGTTQAGSAQVGPAVNLIVPEGFKIGLFAKNLGQVRDLQFSPGGTLLASDLAGKVYALPDKNNDGQADQIKTILTGVNKTHGLAFFQNKLYVAGETSVFRYDWNESRLSTIPDRKIVDLPKGGRHFTRSLAFKKDGTLFITIGSTCDVCEEKDPFIATTIITNSEGTNPRVFSKGLRNAVFIALDQTETPWVTEMGRDFLGDNLPPDEVNVLQDGGDYGWPNCYGSKLHDTNFDKQSFSTSKNTYIRDPCSDTISPAFEIPAHSAPLGLTFVNSDQFPPDWRGDLLVSYHGSWNRSIPDGYKVVHLKRQDHTITQSEDFITGFIQGSQASARPVDLTFDSAGSLYLSDDKSGSVYKIIHE